MGQHGWRTHQWIHSIHSRQIHTLTSDNFRQSLGIPHANRTSEESSKQRGESITKKSAYSTIWRSPHVVYEVSRAQASQRDTYIRSRNLHSFSPLCVKSLPLAAGQLAGEIQSYANSRAAWTWLKSKQFGSTISLPTKRKLCVFNCHKLLKCK